MREQEIAVSTPKIKISVLLSAAALPPIPLDGPTPDLRLKLKLAGSNWTLSARLNSKSYRKMLRTVEKHGAPNVVVILQGDLRALSGGALTLESAGFQVNVKTPAPAPIAPN